MENLKPHLFRFDSAGSTMSWPQSFESWEMTSGKWVWNFLKTISCIFLFALSPVVPATSLSPGYSASPPARPPVHSPLGKESELYKTSVTSCSWPPAANKTLLMRPSALPMLSTIWLSYKIGSHSPLRFHLLSLCPSRSCDNHTGPALHPSPGPVSPLHEDPFTRCPWQTCLSFRPLLQ